MCIRDRVSTLRLRANPRATLRVLSIVMASFRLCYYVDEKFVNGCTGTGELPAGQRHANALERESVSIKFLWPGINGGCPQVYPTATMAVRSYIALSLLQIGVARVAYPPVSGAVRP